MFGLETLLRLVAPYDCLACGREGALLCAGCLGTSVIPAQVRCFRCQAAGGRTSICVACQAETGLSQVWIAANYQGRPGAVIRRYKFQRAKDASRVLADVLLMALPAAPPEFRISYIPTATSRVRERGYDHAKLLAKQYAKLQGRKILPVLARSGQARQVGASRMLRLEQLESAFRVYSPAAVRGQDILLIDDVVTTGATLQVAAKVLREAGARSVSALIVAQKQ